MYFFFVNKEKVPKRKTFYPPYGPFWGCVLLGEDFRGAECLRREASASRMSQASKFGRTAHAVLGGPSETHWLLICWLSSLSPGFFGVVLCKRFR